MTDSEAREMARDLVRGSIIEDAAAQFIAQLLKQAHEDRIKPLRARIEELEGKLAKAVTALRGWIEFANEEGMPVSLSDLEAAGLTGEKK